MSEEEKGWVLLEAGLRVMAGQSPHAIENIAEGLKGVSKEFSADEKAKRLYDRQIGLSSVKYGVEALERDRAQLVKDAREFKWLAFTEPHTDPKTGQHWERGESFKISTADLLNDNFKNYPLGLPAVVRTMITSDATVEKAKNRLASELKAAKIISDKSFSGLRQDEKLHAESIRNVSNNTIMIGLVDSMISKNIGTGRSNITGFRPWLKDKANKVYNAVGGAEYFKVLDELGSTDLQEYRTRMQFVANRLIKEMLGEGSKNISNIDRKLAEEIVGLVKGGNTIFMNDSVLHENLMRVRGIMEDSVVDNYNKLSSVEQRWRNRVYQGGASPLGLMTRQRKTILEERPEKLTLGRKDSEYRPAVILNYGTVMGKDGKLKKGWDQDIRKLGRGRLG